MTSELYDVFRLKVSQRLKAALKSQDLPTVHALRAALHAVDNASARPLAGPADPVLSGAGAASDVVGSTIDRQVIERVLRAEARARRIASRDYEKLGRADKAKQFEDEAEIIQDCLKDLETSDKVAGP